MFYIFWLNYFCNTVVTLYWWIKLRYFLNCCTNFSLRWKKLKSCGNSDCRWLVIDWWLLKIQHWTRPWLRLPPPRKAKLKRAWLCTYFVRRFATVPKFRDRISLFTKKLRLAQYSDGCIYVHHLKIAQTLLSIIRNRSSNTCFSLMSTTKNL